MAPPRIRANMPSFEISDARIHCLVQGSGSPLLFVHGFPLDHSMWLAQVSRFAETHTVLAPDLRGFGRSSITAGTVTMARFADDLDELLTAFGVTEPICLCGLSMGGYIAWAFLQRHRQRLGSLILCDTRAGADNEEARANRLKTAARVEREGTGFLAESMIEKLFGQTARQKHPELVSHTEQVMRSAPPAGVAAAARGMAERPDVTAMLPSIDIPTLAIVGEADAITPPDEMRRLAEAIPAAEFVQIAGAGHMAPLEQPDAVNTAIAGFLHRTKAG